MIFLQLLNIHFLLAFGNALQPKNIRNMSIVEHTSFIMIAAGDNMCHGH